MTSHVFSGIVVKDVLGRLILYDATAPLFKSEPLLRDPLQLEIPLFVEVPLLVWEETPLLV